MGNLEQARVKLQHANKHFRKAGGLCECVWIRRKLVAHGRSTWRWPDNACPTKIDHAVGLEMRVRIGDVVEEGEELLRVFARK